MAEVRKGGGESDKRIKGQEIEGTFFECQRFARNLHYFKIRRE